MTREQRAQPTSNESPFQLDELFFSTTDRRGIITGGNNVFVRVSGYGREELIGQPHNIIRHPDMPRCVFRLLWDTLEQGKPIVAFVKNMARNGDYYWVVALVSPIDDGYLSIRFKPSSALLATVNQLYRDLREHELSQEQAGVSRKSAIDYSMKLLFDRLKEMQFASYEHFMHIALHTEMQSRCSQLGQQYVRYEPGQEFSRGDRDLDRYLHQSSELANLLQRLFAHFGGFTNLEESLRDTATFASDLAFSMQLLSINAAIDSSKLGYKGATMSIVASTIGRSTREIADGVSLVNQAMNHLLSSVHSIGFDMGIALLQVELATFFLKECSDSIAADPSTARERLQSIAPLLRIITGSLPSMVHGAFTAASSIERQLSELSSTSKQLLQTAQSLDFVYMNGRIEVARLDLERTFLHMLEAVKQQLGDTRERFSALDASASAVRTGFGKIGALNFRAHDLLAVMDQQLAAW